MFDMGSTNIRIAGPVNICGSKAHPKNTDISIESQLKAFCDKHDIPVPQPRKRDTILQKARSNYDTVAKKIGETASYPGNWLYETWSESGKFQVIIFKSVSNVL
jgi:Putative nuclear envelope organisation protein